MKASTGKGFNISVNPLAIIKQSLSCFIRYNTTAYFCTVKEKNKSFSQS